ncbi:hypothetical protein TNCV_3589701 [Trichonephila clavipes]|nr:hypothetical protein TNCV_3589701 [Trichonephila clavipes]
MPDISKTTLVHIVRDSSNNVFKDMTYTCGLPVIISLASRVHLKRAWKETAANPENWRINSPVAKTKVCSSLRGLGNLIDSMPRRLLACMGTTGEYTAYCDL